MLGKRPRACPGKGGRSYRRRAPTKQSECCKGGLRGRGLRDGGFKQIGTSRKISEFSGIPRCCSGRAPRQKTKQAEKGWKRPISADFRKGGQTPLEPPFATPPLAAAQPGAESFVACLHLSRPLCNMLSDFAVFRSLFQGEHEQNLPKTRATKKPRKITKKTRKSQQKHPNTVFLGRQGPRKSHVKTAHVTKSLQSFGISGFWDQEWKNWPGPVEKYFKMVVSLLLRAQQDTKDYLTHRGT